MDLPKIDIETLPELHDVVGIFGSTVQALPDLNVTNDIVIIVVIYVFETMPGGLIY